MAMEKRDRPGVWFRAAALGLLLAAPAQAAPHWGSWQVTCTGYGEARYAARLWDIPFGASWEGACQDMTATLRGVTYSTPSRCVNVGPGDSMWGEFDGVPDPSCKPHWGELRDDGCVPGAGFSGLRQRSAILWDVPAGVSWEDACSLTGAEVDGVWHPRPAVCLQSNFSWLGSIGSIIAGAAVGLVTVNPAAGVAAGVAIGTAVLATDAATGGFGAMNEWGVFYAVDPVCGELAGVDPGDGGSGGGGAPMDLSREAVRCERAIDRATGKALASAWKIRSRCLDRETRGKACDAAGRDAKLERADARAELQLTRACSAEALAELGFAGSEEEVRRGLVDAALFEAETLIGETYAAADRGAAAEAARCQQALGRAAGAVLQRTQRAHARCLASEASGRSCDEAARDDALQRAAEAGERRIEHACVADDLVLLGFAEGDASGLVPAAVFGAESLIQASHPLPFPSKP
jgi:hypothetical protein